LLDHDHVVEARLLDRCGAKMCTLGGGRRGPGPELHGHSAARDRASHTRCDKPGDGWRHAERIQRIGQVANVEGS
jgi:hypothetical protein